MQEFQFEICLSYELFHVSWGSTDQQTAYHTVGNYKVSLQYVVSRVSPRHSNGLTLYHSSGMSGLVLSLLVLDLKCKTEMLIN